MNSALQLLKPMKIDCVLVTYISMCICRMHSGICDSPAIASESSKERDFNICCCTDQEEGFSEEPADLSKSGAAVEAVQEHVKGIAALQRLQASQEGYNADPTFRSHRPRFRDHR